MLKWNDCAGEGIVDLGKFFRKAYKRNVALKLFEKKKGVQAARAKREAKHARAEKLIDDGKDIVPDDPEEEQKEGGEGTPDSRGRMAVAAGGAAGGGASAAASMSSVRRRSATKE